MYIDQTKFKVSEIMKLLPARLYDYRFSGNGYKIRLALSQLGMNVDIVFLDILKGETYTSDFLRMNPMGQIPTLELEDGSCIRESNAILLWLTEGTYLMPTNEMERSQVYQWMFFEQSNIDKVLGRTRFINAFPGYIEATDKDWESWYEQGNRALRVLDAHLEEKSYLVGDSYSTADICLYGYVHCADEGGFKMSDYPSVFSWMEKIHSQQKYITLDD